MSTSQVAFNAMLGISLVGVARILARIVLGPQCTYCGKSGHLLKTCPEFVLKKNACTGAITITTQAGAEQANVDGCCAAGVLLWDGDIYAPRLYAVREEREGKTLLNFVGGKRAGRESPAEIAERELDEEVGLKLRVDPDSKCLWSGRSKYFLYPIRRGIKNGCCGETELVLVSPEELKDEAKWHPFAWIMLRKVMKYGLQDFIGLYP
jgi:8-oxo-dGTP pyrophosphatase MutT (NUDIX family)